MKRSSTIFLQFVIVLFAILALTIMLRVPQTEGRNVHATQFEIYFKDPLLAYAYTASIPFFIALYQAFRILGYIRQDAAFSPATVHSLRTIKYCAIAILCFVIVSVAFLPFGDKEDRPPGVMMRIVASFGALIVITAAAIFERISQNAVDLKSEHDLTV